MFGEIITTIVIAIVIATSVSIFTNRKILSLIVSLRADAKKAKDREARRKDWRRRVNSKLFEDVRLAKGLSRYRIAIETELAPQTVRRVFSGNKWPFPSSVKKVGEFLEIPPRLWYTRSTFD